MRLTDLAATIDHRSTAALPSIDFVQSEIRRVGASEGELRRALSLVSSAARLEPRAYALLSKRMRRLVDLLALAGPVSREELWPEDAIETTAPDVASLVGANVVPMSRGGLAGR